jgi:hypothetical protein
MWLPIRKGFTAKSRSFLLFCFMPILLFYWWNYLLCQGRGWSSALGMTLPFSSHPSTSYTQWFTWGGWGDKLLARLPATAALWVRIQTFLKNQKWTTKAKEWPAHSSPPKKKKNYDEVIHFVRIMYLCIPCVLYSTVLDFLEPIVCFWQYSLRNKT